MVHGFTQSSDYFSSQVPNFRRDFRILLIDLRGHGKSANAPGPYGVEEYADDVLAVLDGAEVEKAHFWGTHIGAAAGLVLSLRQPERLSSLVLEGPFLPGFNMPKVPELIGRARSIAQSRGIKAALDDWFEHADWFEYMRDHPQACRSKEHKAMILEFGGMPLLNALTARQVTPVTERIADIRLPRNVS
jgi:pimeloyl-ACP methyl ester carboxylesterase